MNNKLENLEAHSCRNNLRFNGIEGDQLVSWNESEDKIRNFITGDLDIPELKDVEIERAHRLKSGSTAESRTIMVKFSKYRDRDSVLQKSKGVLSKQSPFSVQQDFTERVKNIEGNLVRK